MSLAVSRAARVEQQATSLPTRRSLSLNTQNHTVKNLVQSVPVAST